MFPHWQEEAVQLLDCSCQRRTICQTDTHTTLFTVSLSLDVWTHEGGVSETTIFWILYKLDWRVTGWVHSQLTLSPSCPALLLFSPYSAVIWKKAALTPLKLQSGWSVGFREPSREARLTPQRFGLHWGPFKAGVHIDAVFKWPVHRSRTAGQNIHSQLEKREEEPFYCRQKLNEL